uniref:Hesp-178 n=1 Tax=Melampsora lini TaxID=5261 RepID=Q2MV42_MELLI|nr:hesp-178 [Melampsora lini]
MTFSILRFLLLAPVVYQVGRADDNSTITPSSFAGNIPPCAVTCITEQANNSPCGGISHLSCLCNDGNYQSAISSCMQKTCDSTAASSAMTYATSLCASIGINAAAPTSSSAKDGARSASPPTAILPSLGRMSIISAILSSGVALLA